MGKNKNKGLAPINANQQQADLFNNKGKYPNPYNANVYNNNIVNHNSGRQRFNSVKEKQVSDIQVLIRPQVWKDVVKCLEELKNVEFSGIILYKKSGSLKDLKNVILEVEYFLLMDVGTVGYTEFTMDDSLLEFCREHEGVIPNTTHHIGKLHSHHNMDCYHSAVDIDDILLNLDDNTHYLSIVINNNLKLDTRLGTYKESVVNEVVKYYDLNDELVSVESTKNVKDAILYDCITRLDFNMPTTVDQKLKTLIGKKQLNSHTNYGKHYGGTQSYLTTDSNNINIKNSSVLPSKNSKYGFLPTLDVEQMIWLTECLAGDMEDIFITNFNLNTVISLSDYTFTKIIEYIFPTNYTGKSIQVLIHALDEYLLEEKKGGEPGIKYFTVEGYKVIETLIEAIHNMRGFLNTYENNYRGNFIKDVCTVLGQTPYSNSSFLQTLHRELTTPLWTSSKNLLK